MLVYKMTNEELTRFANQVKDLITEKFNVEGLENCAIVIVEKGMFGKAWEKLFSEDNESANIQIMMSIPSKQKE